MADLAMGLDRPPQQEGGAWPPLPRSSAPILTRTRWRGEAELTKFATTVVGSAPCRHWSYNRLLTQAGDCLESVSYMNVYYLDAPPESRLITGVMRDRLARTGAGWRFASRRITFD
jgi:hypothetical protein